MAMWHFCQVTGGPVLKWADRVFVKRQNYLKDGWHNLIPLLLLLLLQVPGFKICNWQGVDETVAIQYNFI
jgi:hypothetical protein